MRGQVVEVQKSEDKMWGAISQMDDELQDLATREDNSKSEDGEQEASPEDSDEETMEVPHNVTSPIPLFGIPPTAPTVSSGTFDAVRSRDSVGSDVPRQPAPPM